METKVRYDMLIDSVAHQELLDLICAFEGAECSVHRAAAGKIHKGEVTEDDFSDALAHDYFVIFIPEGRANGLEKILLKLGKKYGASLYKSSCQSLL